VFTDNDSGVGFLKLAAGGSVGTCTTSSVVSGSGSSGNGDDGGESDQESSGDVGSGSRASLPSVSTILAAFSLWSFRFILQ